MLERTPLETNWSTADDNNVEKLWRAENLPPAAVQAWRGATSLTLISTRTVAAMVVKQSSYSLAASARAAGIASGTATGIGSGSATAREKNIIATAMITLKGIIITLIEEDEVCGRYNLVCG